MTQSVVASIDAIQQRLRPKLFQESKDRPTENGNVTDLFKEILSYDVDLCEAAFGSFGTKLHEAAKELDLDHPEIKSGKFLSSIGDEDTFKKMTQFLRLTQLAKENKLEDISPIFSKCVTKAILPDVKSGMDLLKNQQQYVRLLSSVEERLRLRKVKQVRPVECDSFLKKVIGIWDDIASLEVYSRFGNYYEEQTSQLKKRVEVYRELRLSTFVSDIMDSMNEFKQGYEESYYGFQRVPMALAALVIGKMHGCYLNDKQDTVMFPAANFDGLNFEYEPQTYFDSSGSGVQNRPPDYEYAPMAYPIYSTDIPEGVLKVIEHLDSFPEANGRSIFDHYIAIVPGVRYPRMLQINNEYHLYEVDRTRKSFSKIVEARVSLDAMLVRERKIVPAVLGEKDGKCYFICLWE